MNRRLFLLGSSAVAALGAAALALRQQIGLAHAAEGEFPVKLSDAEWKAKLSPEAYAVLREHATERAGTSPLNAEHREGVFRCAGCDNAVYSSAHKFESGTGWPSFFQPIDTGAVGTSTDYKLLYPRTEVHCADCGGHLGHVFDDGPAPTGLRYCMNGVAMRFDAGAATAS